MADEPKRLIGDKAYDSDSLDAALAKRGIEMSIAAIAPLLKRRTVGRCDVTSGDGRLNA